jgi:hypothetical protein
MRRCLGLPIAAAIFCIGILPALFGCGADKKAVSSGNGPANDLDTTSAFWKVEISHETDVIQGRYLDVDITLAACSTAVGGFDLKTIYHANVLIFAGAELGQYFLDCGWEYFTYRNNYCDTCGQVPMGVVRLIGLADTNNGAVHPDEQCIADAAGEILAKVKFFVSNDRQWECTKHPIRFYWDECGDNTIMTYSGDSLGFNRAIYDTDSTRIEDYQAGLPGYFGADTSCLHSDKIYFFRGIDFVNGGIDIKCGDSIQIRGDLDMNGLANEIADAVLYTDYFKHGISVFEPHVEASIAASDVNGDGETLTLADLQYLIRIIQGDAMPFPQQPPDTTAVVVYTSGHVHLASPVDVGAILLKFDLNGVPGSPTLNVPDMSMGYSIYSSELRVLIYNIGSGFIPAGTADIVTVPATAVLTDAEAAGYEGNKIHVTIE